MIVFRHTVIYRDLVLVRRAIDMCWKQCVLGSAGLGGWHGDRERTSQRTLQEEARKSFLLMVHIHLGRF